MKRIESQIPFDKLKMPANQRCQTVFNFAMQFSCIIAKGLANLTPPENID